ncbi:hypothetical protein WICMUC_001733 [Wickerhamomyces mucosus]|uniref:Alpha/beta hydrolase fold-3 domain-containing protein n=1 Tax=Wickerhamomyces mucosus TaxID=1378264 RepID=A0A9P8TGD5_9ASCO|nr:hypothetical protein WICMUC_001733 [Wickerhamomyces mucosus]
MSTELRPWEDPEVRKHYDPKLIEFFETIQSKYQQYQLDHPDQYPDISHLTAVEQRRANASRYSLYWRDVYKTYLPIDEIKDNVQVIDSTIDSFDGYKIPVKIYKNKNSIVNNIKTAVHISYHGGGFAQGGLYKDAYQYYWLVHLAGVTVIDVGYRLIPENHYLVSYLDSFAVLNYVYKHGEKNFNIDSKKISIGGTSAGAKLTLALSHLARDNEIPLALAFANVPIAGKLSLDGEVDPNSSWYKFRNDPQLNWNSSVAFRSFKEDSNQKSYQINPSQIESFFGNSAVLENLQTYYEPQIGESPNWSNLPRTVIVVAESDPLNDSGKFYAKKLIDHGVEIKFKEIKGLGHQHADFSNLFDQSKEYLYFFAKTLKDIQDGNSF